MLGYNTIERFLNKIHESQNKTVNPKYISLWVREILIVDPEQAELDEAQNQICKDKNFELRIAIVCDFINRIKHFHRHKKST